MDRLLDSFKVANNETYSIMYFLIFVITLTLVIGAFSIFMLIKNGFTLSWLVSKMPALPNIAVNSALYFLAGAIFIIILYVLARSQMDTHTLVLSNSNQGIIPPYKTFWSPHFVLNSIDPKNLRVTETEWSAKNCNALTLGVEIVIFNSRTTSTDSSPYRNLLYRGSEDLPNFIPNSPGSTPQGAGGLNDGLPSEMSPGIFVDRFTNDLIVFVDTDPIDAIYKDINHAFRESIRINDLPLNVPFYLHLTLKGKILEVYVNCRLAGTKLLHGKPRNVPNEWYGRTGFAAAQAVVQNLTLWDGTLNTFDLMKMCGRQIVIKKETWDFVLQASLPTIGLSKCGEITMSESTFRKEISIEHT